MTANKPRSIAMDLIRCFAFFSVVSVHFFLHNGYYNHPVEGWQMILMTLIRTFFMVCVPLFLTLSGYLMCRKRLEISYYKGIVRTLGIYVLASLVCYLFICYRQEVSFSFGAFLLGIVGNYNAAAYGWYIEMYLGLFLLIPFLNLCYHGLSSRGQKTVLVLTLIGLTSFSGLLQWNGVNLLPDWWQGIYPFTYYFIGCYLREFDLKLPKWAFALMLLGSVVVFGGLNVYKSYGTTFQWGAWQDWGSLQNVVTTVLVFSLMKDVRFSSDTVCPGRISGILKKVSGWCLGAYLVSSVFDQLFYPILNARVPNVPDRLPYFLIMVPLIFVCSLGLSALLNLGYDLLGKGCGRMIKFFVRSPRTRKKG